MLLNWSTVKFKWCQIKGCWSFRLYSFLSHASTTHISLIQHTHSTIHHHHPPSSAPHTLLLAILVSNDWLWLFSFCFFSVCLNHLVSGRVTFASELCDTIAFMLNLFSFTGGSLSYIKTLVCDTQPLGFFLSKAYCPKSRFSAEHQHQYLVQTSPMNLKNKKSFLPFLPALTLEHCWLWAELRPQIL